MKLPFHMGLHGISLPHMVIHGEDAFHMISVAWVDEGMIAMIIITLIITFPGFLL